MKKFGKEKVIAGTLTILLFASVLAGLFFFKENFSLKTSLDVSKLRNESLLSEKLGLEKAILQFKKELNDLKGKNSELDKILADANRKLSEKERTIANLTAENSTTKNLKKQLAEVNELRAELQRQIDVLNAQNNNLIAENRSLQNSLTAMEDKNNSLQKLLNEANDRPDNFMVESYKNVKKNKLTLNAKRTKKITVLFDLPQEYISGVSFNITTPEGKVITDKDNSLLTWEVQESVNLIASIKPVDGELNVTSQVKLTYTPKSKLTSGEYKIGVVKDNKKIGNVRVRLI